MKFIFILASRSRHNKFWQTVDNIRNMMEGEFKIIASLDEDDEQMSNRSVRTRLESQDDIEVRWGLSKSKIHAINRACVNLPEFDILINMSDDQRFSVKGFDKIIEREMPEDQDALIHFPEVYARDRVCVMSIMGRKYFERTGHIYDPQYYSLWADEEETNRAKMLGKYRYVDQVIFIHQHYSNQHYFTPKDKLYIRNDTYRTDGEVYLKRKEKNFLIPDDQIVKSIQEIDRENEAKKQKRA